VADRIDFLFQEWHQLGGKTLVAEVDRSITPRRVEEVIAESTAHCRESGRLTWILLDWLIRHIDQIDEQALVRMTKSIGDL
jgi:hemerythrin